MTFRFEGHPGGDVRSLHGPDGVARSFEAFAVPFRLRSCPGSDPGHLFFQEGCVAGLEVIEMKPGLGSYFGTDVGVLVTEVDEGSTLGLEPGDVVVKVGDREVDTPESLRRILERFAGDEEITFEIRRQGRDTTVTGRLGM